MIPDLTSTLDKESVARLLDLIYASPVPFVKAGLAYTADGGEEDNFPARFFTLSNRPGKEPAHIDLYILDKNVSDQGKSQTYTAISRYKVSVKASQEDGQWVIHSCHLEKLPRTEKRIFKAKQQENLERTKPYALEKLVTSEIRKHDSLQPYRMSKGDRAFFSTKKYPGRNIALFVKNQKYKEKWRIENLVAWCLQICLDLQSIHKSGWLHLDIKPANVVLDPNDTKQAKLIDLEFAIPKTLACHSLDGTHGYIATELYVAHHEKVVNGSKEPIPYSEKSDIFALAYTLAALLGNTSIEALLEKAKLEKMEDFDFINAVFALGLEENPKVRFKNLFSIQGQDIFQDYPNPKNAEKIKTFLIKLFMNMSHPDAKIRPSLDDVIKKFEKVQKCIKRDYSKQAKASSAEKQEPDAETPSSSI